MKNNSKKQNMNSFYDGVPVTAVADFGVVCPCNISGMPTENVFKVWHKHQLELEDELSRFW